MVALADDKDFPASTAAATSEANGLGFFQTCWAALQRGIHGLPSRFVTTKRTNFGKSSGSHAHYHPGGLKPKPRPHVLPGGCAPQLVPAYEDRKARLRGTVALWLAKHFSA